MNAEEIVEALKELRGDVRQRYKAEIKGIFGSFARGEEIKDSDLDVLVEFGEEANLLHLVGLSLFLEEKLQISADVVPCDSLREEIKDDIMKETLYL